MLLKTDKYSALCDSNHCEKNSINKHCNSISTSLAPTESITLAISFQMI